MSDNIKALMGMIVFCSAVQCILTSLPGYLASDAFLGTISKYICIFKRSFYISCSNLWPVYPILGHPLNFRCSANQFLLLNNNKTHLIYYSPHISAFKGALLKLECTSVYMFM